MKKWTKLLKSVLISLLIYMWFLGSSLLIRIDTESKLETLFQKKYSSQVEIWEYEMRNLSQKLASHCKKENSVENVNPSVKTQVEKESERKAKYLLLQAREEKLVRDNLIYIPELKQVWCLVPKAASTSWSHKIVDSLHHMKFKFRKDLRNETIPVQVSLRHHYGNVGTKTLKHVLHSKDITRVLLARHPFSRIVSAFEDKLKNRRAKPDSMYFYGHYGVKINRSYRKNRKFNKLKEPTFEEFVDYLIETDPMNYDDHWKPISILCGVCTVNYDHIIRQEGLGKTISFHLKKLGFLDVSTKHAELRDENKSSWQFQTVNEYFKNISNSKLQKLLKRYEDDLNLLDYNHPI